MRLFRMMKVDDTGSKPRIGDTFGRLGVRPSTRTTGTVFDIPVDPTGVVHPGPDGLSTFDSANRPDPKLVDWVIETADLPPDLAVVPSATTEGRYHIVPRRPMTLAEYQQLLAATQDDWEPV